MAGPQDNITDADAGVTLAGAGGVPAGAELAALLEQAAITGPAGWDAATAVGVIQGIRRQTGHLAALEAAALAAMVDMPEYQVCAAPDRGSLGDLATEDDDHRDATGDEPDGTFDGGSGARVRGRVRRHAHDPVAVVASEVSAAIRVSPNYAKAMVADAVALVTDRPATHAALAAGVIDAVKAHAIVDTTIQIGATELTDDQVRALLHPEVDPAATAAAIHARDAAAAEAAALRDQVETAALDRAGTQTLPQLRNRLRALLHRADPAAAERRTARARRDRQLCPPRSFGDGTASITARGPLADLAALYAAVDAAARHAHANGDDRTLDQLRFDALTGATGWDALRRGHLGCCAPTCNTTHDHATGDTTDTVTAGGMTGATAADTTGATAAADTRATAGRATSGSDSSGSDSSTRDSGSGTRDSGRRRESGTRNSGSRRDTGLDSGGRDVSGRAARTGSGTVGAAADALAGNPSAGAPTDAATGGVRATNTPAGNLPGSDPAPRSRAGDQTGDHLSEVVHTGHAATAPPVEEIPHTLQKRLQRQPVGITITIPLSVLLGLSDAPAEIDTPTGPEPLTATVARALAFSDDATWRRLITDPVSGTVLDVGRTRYRPPAALVDHIAHRDRTSRFPTTTTPATSCEIDHCRDYASGGTTSHDNLALLSSTIHDHKTLHPWTLEQTEPGVFEWTSPAGIIHTVYPDPPDTLNPDPLMTPVPVTDDDETELPPF